MTGKAIESLKQTESARAAKGFIPSFAGSPLAWIDAERTRATERWSHSGLPSRKDEAWKYTNVASIADSVPEIASVPSQTVIGHASAFLRSRPLEGQVAAELVFVNGSFVASLSKIGNESGLTFVSLATLNASASSSLNAKVKADLERANQILASSEHQVVETPFSALNSSFFSDGGLIHVAAGMKVSAPVVLTFVTTSRGVAAESLLTASPRVMAIFGRMSKTSLVERHLGGSGERYFANKVTNACLLDGAHVSYALLQEEGDSGIHIGSTRFHLSRDSRLESLQISLGASLSRQDLTVRLAASGAEAVVDGLYVVRGSQHVDNHTNIEHVVGDTKSEQVYKGILDDRSRAVFNGRVWIAKDAQRSNSSQLNNNLILSVKAEVDTKPELEIYADDVKAAHGATVGRLDPEHLFYLKSRAIAEADAIQMLAQGFALDVVLRRSDEALRQLLVASVARHVAELKHVADLKVDAK